MTKKTWIVAALLFALAVTAAWAQREYVETSEGAYELEVKQLGRNSGQRAYDEWGNHHPPHQKGIRLTQGQWEAVNNALARYNTRRGDTYQVYLAEPGPGIFVYCEFTSATEYKYWALRFLSVDEL